MQDLGNKLKEFYNNCEEYKRNLEKLELEWYERCLKQFSKFIFDKNRCILDLGCGIGTATRYLSKEFRNVIGLDYSLKFCKYSKEMIKEDNSALYINSDACYLPFKNECVDGIFLNSTIEHLYDVKKALEEMHRVLRKEGVILIHMPNLITPLRPIKAIFSREKLKYPKPESGENFLHSVYLILRDIFLITKKYGSSKIDFIYRQPNFEITEGDYDAVYLSSPLDIKKYFSRRNYEVNDITYIYKSYQGKGWIKKALKWFLYKTRILQMVRMPPGTYATLILRKH